MARIYICCLLILGVVSLFGCSAAKIDVAEQIPFPGHHVEDVVQKLHIEKTRIKVSKPDGDFVTNEELVGAVLLARNSRGIKEEYRIEHIEPYSSKETGEILFYSFSRKEPQSGEWLPMCQPDRLGRRIGFPLQGYWDEKGVHHRSNEEYSITCTSGTIGKCVLFGYLPWAKSRSGKSLWSYHQACVRLLRADYCGNGRPHTREGTLVEVWDREEVQIDTSTPGLSFEAAWNEHGAVCLRKTRIPSIAIVDDILRECPEKLGGKTGPENCKESFENAEVRLLNRSGDNL